jgi:cobalamin biosynthesis protein CobD/CbiB
MALLLAPLRWLTSSIIRLAILAGILVAAYFLLLKPAIHSGEKTVNHSIHSLERAASPKRLKHCVERANGNVEKMKRCATKF